MRNWLRSSGVYTNMLRVPLFLAFSLAGLAQPSPRQNPMDAAIQAVQQVRYSGRTEEIAALREQAHALLQRVPVDAPQFANWAQQVARLYQSPNRNANWNAAARAILQEALVRTRPLGDSHPSRLAILDAMGWSWRQDGNLLKAVAYLEQAAAGRPDTPSAIYSYTSLASLYRQLGRPDAVAAIAVKIRALASGDPTALAQFYEQQGQLEEAAAIYRTLAEQPADAQAKSNAWQSLANLYARQERYPDAVAATQQAFAALQSSNNPHIVPSSWMRQNLAGLLRQAGQIDQADQVYQQLMQDYGDGGEKTWMMTMYAQHLSQTKRAAQGESLLQDFLAGHLELDAAQKMNVLYSLSNIARSTGDSKRGDEYQRAAQALQPPQPPTGRILIGDELQKVQEAANQHRWDDAYGLALHVIDDAAQAADGQQLQWVMPPIAQQLADNKEPAKAEHLFQRLLALVRNWSADNTQPLIAVTQSYARFLMSQPDRLGDVPAGIEQYRSVLTDANGLESASLTEPVKLKIDFALSQSQWEHAEVSARELLELQESLSGNTSEPYLGDLQTAARAYQAAGDSLRALALHRKAVTIADLLATSNKDWRRAQTRMDVALLLAQLGQFDEAGALGDEAVALQPQLTEQLEEIRQMKQAAQPVG
jgi:tetratricopeptide (TPR) repeat protein